VNGFRFRVIFIRRSAVNFNEAFDIRIAHELLDGFEIGRWWPCWIMRVLVG